jgi:hypothetical protein
MFHTYILTKGGSMVDFDRASFLMDDELLQRALEARQTARQTGPSDAAYGAQSVWDDYCQRHQERYGEGFVCDITPGWDDSAPPPRDWTPG